MNKIEVIASQTEDSYLWTNKLIDSIPLHYWENTPEIIDTNISWQVGHLIVSLYYHSIMVISGHQMEVLRMLPLKEYDNFFTKSSPKDCLGMFTPNDLREHFQFMQNKSLQIIKALSDKNLDEKLEPSSIPHPIAQSKFEALDWNIKHTMWHCGQIGILKRIIHERFNFGLGDMA